MSTLSISAQLELRHAQEALQAISEQQTITKADQRKFDALLSRISVLKSGALSEEVRQRQLDDLAREMGTAPVQFPSETSRLSREDSKILRNYLVNRQVQTRAGMSVATDSDGGFFVPQTFYRTITTALKQMDGLWNSDVVTMYEDTHGNVLTCPLMDDTGASAVIVGENTNGAENEIATIDRLSLGKIPTWRSGKLITSMELAQDAAFPLEEVIIAPAISARFQRGISAANVSTLISSTTSGATSTGATAATLDDCLSLMSSIDPAYLASPKCFWGMNFTTLMGLIKQKDSTGRYIWHPRTDDNGRLLLWEKPIVLMPSLPNATASAQGTVVLGDFSRCIRRVVKNSMTLLRYQNAPGLAEYGLFAYQAFLRTSFGVLASASSESPIKYLTQAAS